MQLIPKEVNDFKAGGGEVVFIGNDDYEFYFRKPNKADISKMVDSVRGEKRNLSSIMDSTVRQAMIYPSPLEYDEILKEKPGLYAALYNKLYEDVGITESFLSKKI
ncbi:MAG TPA: hypothetical protein DHW82_09725 [Spirochaetia bacterium]|nr:MAG: hypothetical protein A2Y41_00435 [Spirochaetes bacterium GWB1_36_13]HCL57270.1 hypothetical protein [Spirochaetia bacterium]